MYGSEKKLKDYQEFKHGRVYPIFNCPTFFEHIFPLIFAQIIEAKKVFTINLKKTIYFYK